MWVSFFLLIIKDVGRLEDAQNRLAIKQLIKEVGEPRNYGLTDEEKAEEERKAAEERLAREALEEAFEEWRLRAEGGQAGVMAEERTTQPNLGHASKMDPMEPWHELGRRREKERSRGFRESGSHTSSSGP